MTKLTRQNGHRSRAGVSAPACKGALMCGGAFTIGDALVAIRWAEQIRSRGYRVVITPRYQNSDEVIEVYIPNTTKPTFMVYHAASSVRIADCIGLTLSFPTLTDALVAMVPLPKSGRRKMLKGVSPAWLPEVAEKSTQEVDNLWACRSMYASLRFRLASIVGSSKRRKLMFSSVSPADSAMMDGMGKMNQAMNAAPVTGDPDRDFVAMMILQPSGGNRHGAG